MIKCDLHIHTVSTKSDRAFEFSVECLKNYILVTGLDVVAITNHNCFDIKQFYEIQDEVGDKACVLPGIEIDIGKGTGHLLIIADPQSVEDFSFHCSSIEDDVRNGMIPISTNRLREVFQDLSKYLIIPHYEKSPSIDKTTLEELKDNIFCGEVSSVKKFIYCKRNEESLTPVYFSDWRPVEGGEFPSRQTWIDAKDATISALKYALSDKSKVHLSDDEGHHIFQVLPNIKMSTGLTVVLGERSSGKTYTLNRISETYDNVKYIPQFSLLELDSEKAKVEFTNRIAEKQSIAMRDYFLQFSRVVDDIVNVSIASDEVKIENYLSSLQKHASEVDRADMFSRCNLYAEGDYSVNDLSKLRELISAVQKLLDTQQYAEIIEKIISRDRLIQLHNELIEAFITENQISLKETWVNDVIHNIKRNLQSRTADTRVEDVDFYKVQMNRRKVERFCQLAEMIKQPLTIDEQEIEGFKIRVSKAPFSGAGELKLQSGKVIAFSDIYDSYTDDPYKYLLGVAKKDGIEAKDYYQFFAKIDYTILNKYGYEVSGGERAEFNLLQEINDAYQYDMLLIDEPESSFDNLFLHERVNHIIKEISDKMPVVIVTHNNTVGASVKPDYIVYTVREIIDNEASFDVYYGTPDSKMLENRDGKTIENIKVTLDCLEAGQDAYDERRRNYEMLRN